MHDDRRTIELRLRRTLERLRAAVHSQQRELEVGIWEVDGEPVPVPVGLAASYRQIETGYRWGAAWDTAWFRLTGRLPDEWTGRTVEAVVDLDFDSTLTGFQVEALVYRPDGSVVKALNPQSRWIRIAAPAVGGEQVELYLEAAANPVMLGGGGNDFTPTLEGDRITASRRPLYSLRHAILAVVEQPVWELIQDLEVLGELAAELDPADARRWEILLGLDRAMDRLDVADLAGSATAARDELTAVFASPARASAHRVSAIGHAHIDSAWLWPLRETVRKVARTCANVTDLMDSDPALRYAMSSAQQFQWLKDHRPEVYRRVVSAVATGQFIPVGGMWVESDTNMPGGEALARQFNYGKRFFLDEFGVDTQEVWLPDSFGYSAALPQLIALSGSRWFLSQKISWNHTNRFPHHTFLWEGLDGTRIFTHFPPVDTYNSVLSGAELAHAARNFADQGRASRSLVPFGYGDGGGGPTREMLARARRLGDLDGSPTVQITPPAEFFLAAEKEYEQPPVWVGEMYLESHRGTYTSQLATKQGNRRSEHLLREAELWSAVAAVRTGHPYPYQELDEIWKLVLLHQFHDILPGSSIAWVHREAALTYADCARRLGALIESAQRALAGDEAGGQQLTFNAAPHARSGIPGLAAALVPAPPAAPAVAVVQDADGYLLSNGALRVHVDRGGIIVRATDLIAGRELLPPGGRANLLQLHPDTPNRWDAWDIDDFYRRHSHELLDVSAIDVLPDGLRIQRSFGRSEVTTRLTLAPAARRIDFDVEIDWHEREKLLKVAFDLDVAADRSAAETQFGHVFRATHTNTSWEAAKFEICAHRWLHVGEPGFGAALVNDSTYGHDVSRQARPGGGISTTVRLSLIRAPLSPDPATDQGRHRLRYALVVGEIADAVREGYHLNLDPRTMTGTQTVVAPIVEIDDDAVVVESVKLADDRSGDVVVRLYESLGSRRTATLRPGFGCAGVQRVDLLERPLPDAPAEPGSQAVGLSLGPFQIVTLRLARSQPDLPG